MKTLYYHKLVVSVLVLVLPVLAACTTTPASSSDSPSATALKDLPVRMTAAPAPTTAPTAAPSPPADTPAPPTAPPVASPPATPLPGHMDVVTDLATVTGIEVFLLESFPVQVHIQASGTFPDSCTAISNISQVYADGTFRVTMTTQRPAQAMCPAVITPFEQAIPLQGVVGLEAGTYTVVVNGVEGTFSLPVDNVAPSD